jgi:ferric-dicitrate binding protein FerR (iron transport regulator)
MRRINASEARRAVSGRIGVFNGAHSVQRVFAFLVAVAVLNLSAVAAYASPGASAHAGEITVVGGATVDGSPAVSGQTIFSGSVFDTERNSLSTISLGNLGRVELAADTSLKLDFSGARVAGSLDAGRVRVFIPEGLSAAVKTPDAVVASDAGQPAVFSVATERGATTVVVQAGRVEVRAGEAQRRLNAGQSYSSAEGAQPQQGAGQSLTGGKRKGLFAAIAAAVAVVVIVLTARDDKQIPSSNCVGGPIILSGVMENPCF